MQAAVAQKQQTPLQRAEALWDRWARDHDAVSATTLAEALDNLAAHCRTLDSGDLQARVGLALSSLSFTEEQALGAVLRQLGAPAGILVVTATSDAAGVGRGSAVASLQKLASAGVLRTSSLGMKGTRLDFSPPEAYSLLVAALERKGA